MVIVAKEPRRTAAVRTVVNTNRGTGHQIGRDGKGKRWLGEFYLQQGGMQMLYHPLIGGAEALLGFPLAVFHPLLY